jgi:hypothetical protein
MDGGGGEMKFKMDVSAGKLAASGTSGTGGTAGGAGFVTGSQSRVACDHGRWTMAWAAHRWHHGSYACRRRLICGACANDARTMDSGTLHCQPLSIRVPRCNPLLESCRNSWSVRCGVVCGVVRFGLVEPTPACIISSHTLPEQTPALAAAACSFLARHTALPYHGCDHVLRGQETRSVHGRRLR